MFKNIKSIIGLTAEINRDIADIDYDYPAITLANYKNEKLFRDINFLADNNELFRVYTQTGKYYLDEFLINTIADDKELRARQTLFCNDKGALSQGDLIYLRENEYILYWFRDHLRDNTLYSHIYLPKWLKRCNNNRSIYAINFYKSYISPILTIINPLLYLGVIYIVIRMKFNITLPFSWLLSLIYNAYFKINLADIMNLKNKTAIITLVWSIFSLIMFIMGIVQAFYYSRLCNNIRATISDRIDRLCRIIYIISGDNINSELNRVRNLPVGFMGECDKLALFYKILHGEYKDIIINSISELGKLDRDQAIIAGITRLGLVPCNYINADKPEITAKGLYHPLLKFPVKNDVSAGNQLITGPNAAGKSTYLKGILYNIILAQTVGYVAADNMNITLFDNILSHINNEDEINTASLFQNELNKILNIVDIADKSQGKTAIFIDELFNSTNMIEGSSAYIAIAEKLAEMQGVQVYLTTHFSNMARLNESLYKRIRYDAVIARNVEGVVTDISFQYKIADGLSQQYIALELLKKKMGEKYADIFDCAISYKNELISSAK